MNTRLTNPIPALNRASRPQNSRPFFAPENGSHNHPRHALTGLFVAATLLLSLALFMPGCTDSTSAEPGLDGSGRSDASMTGGSSDDEFSRFDYTAQNPQGLNDLDLGGDWATGDSRGVSTQARQNTGDASGDDGRGGWGILLKTFSGPDHPRAARTMIAELSRIDPELRAAYVRSRDSGSLVLFGRYTQPDDSGAQSDLEWIKSMKNNGRPIFPLARLAPVQPTGGSTAGRFAPGSLMSARAQYPEVDPLYTIEVAVWISDDRTITPNDARRRAENYAGELRTRNIPAFFHHDDIKGVSSVTVGLFDRRAINPRTNEVTGSAREMMMQFPYRLNNGEPLEIFKDPNNPGLGKYPQRPELVLVPRLR